MARQISSIVIGGSFAYHVYSMGGALTRKLRALQQLPRLAAKCMSSVYLEDRLELSRSKVWQGRSGFFCRVCNL